MTISIVTDYAIEEQWTGFRRSLKLIHPCRYPSCLVWVYDSKAYHAGQLYVYSGSRLCRGAFPREIMDRIRFIVKTMEL